MAINATDIIHYNSLLIPTNDTDPVGGEIDTSSEITSVSTISFIPQYVNISESSDVTWYYKSFMYNDNATDTWNNATIYINNLLLDVASDNIVTLYSDSSSDDDTYYIRIIGQDSSGNEIEENVTLDGVNNVYSLNTYSYVWRIEKRVVSSSNLSNAIGNIIVNCGTDIGKIPSGFSTATNEISIGLDLSLDGTLQSTDRLTAPTGITFYKPNIEADALLFNGTSGNVPVGSAQGIWLKIVCKEGVKPSSSMFVNYVLGGY